MRKKPPAPSASRSSGSSRTVRAHERVSATEAEQAPLGGGLLVVVELGAEWPGEATLARAAAGMRRVLSQTEGETPAAFAERVAGAQEGLFGRGIRLETIVLACNERIDDAAEAARRKTLSVALGSMAKHKSGRAYLAASGRSSGRLRHALSSLSQGLFDEWRTAGLEVSVDFGDLGEVADRGQGSRLSRAAPPTFLFTARVA